MNSRFYVIWARKNYLMVLFTTKRLETAQDGKLAKEFDAKYKHKMATEMVQILDFFLALVHRHSKSSFLQMTILNYW